ncbi:hypothetical protein [Thalassotalea montiporae]
MSFAKPVVAAILGALSIISFTYLLGTSGAFYYDDFRPLSALAKVHDFHSALTYILTETSGPLGRSVSMLSFLPHVDDWPENPQAFFIGNIIVHLLCGALVFSISYLLLKLINSDSNISSTRLYIIALACAFFWLVLPIHAATVLIAIQRMAQLSTLFVLLGVAIYLWGLRKQQLNYEQEPVNTNKFAGLGLQATGVLFGTLLAMFSKENGLLLPVFILVAEVSLLHNLQSIKRYQNYRVYAGLAALIAILGALLVSAINTGNNPVGRDFTLVERLMTQPQILIEYARLAFLPNVEAINPFYDGYIAVTSVNDFTFIISSISLGLMLIGAIVYRKKYPLFSFAVLWFITAHLIESTVIPLELFFLHRNYLALVGPCVAVVIAIAGTKHKLIQYSSLAYLAILTLMLGLTTSLWGNQQQAAEQWFVMQKNSERASGSLIRILAELGKYAEAKSAIDYRLNTCTDCTADAFKASALSCILGQNNESLDHFNKAESSLAKVPNYTVIPAGLTNLVTLKSKGLCPTIGLNQLIEVNQSLSDYNNLKFGQLRITYENLVTLFRLSNNILLEEKYAYFAWQEGHSHQAANIYIAILIRQEKNQEAQQFIRDKMCQKLPNNPFLKADAKQRCALKLKELEQMPLDTTSTK